MPADQVEPLGLDWFASESVQRLEGAQRLEAGLAGLGIHTLLDLLTYYPHRHIDRTRMVTVRDARPDDEGLITLLLTVKRVDSPPSRNRGKKRVIVTAGDGTGNIQLVFFNQPWRARRLQPGMELHVSGKVTEFRGARQLTNPLVDLVGDQVNKIVPVYRQSVKSDTSISTRDIAELVAQVLRRASVRGFAEPLPDGVRRDLGLMERGEAFARYHDPKDWGDIARARKRLAFEELLRVQLALALRRRALVRTAAGIEHRPDGPLVARFGDRLPFDLTADQRRVVDEIFDDLRQPIPMHRLLQGDVGSGKTVVAVLACLAAIGGGQQAAIMVPTEVLAEQHHLAITELLDGLTIPADDDGTLFDERPVRVGLLTNRTTASARTKLHAALASGEIDLLIGTHALLEEKVEFRSLGVVIIDEQHRFGVEQRATLREKRSDGTVPDVLVMTATPIPRSAAMTVYGDLDTSTIAELPPGRRPITTIWARTPDAEAGVWDRLRTEVAHGRQCYVVCPLIEESDKLEAAAATEVYERLSHTELAGLRVELLHGRMKSGEKEAVMNRFRSGVTHVLVSTTVIEVGVDVPNATVMVILDADRFGLAQLHQLRGRVGRGAHDSHCYLIGEPTSEVGEERLSAFEREINGFVLAETDLDLRGEGTIFGSMQKGRSDLKLASLRKDREMIVTARQLAFSLVDDDHALRHHPLLERELAVFIPEEERDWLLKG